MTDASKKRTAVLTSAAAKLLRPLVRVLLRYGVSFNEFAQLARHAYVRVALEDFAIEGRKQSTSRVSVLTGLTRKEVQRLLDSSAQAESEVGERYNRAARVVAGWVRDKDFAGRDGNPRPLAFDGESASFSSLVRRHAGDVPARAVLDELVRVGSVDHGTDGTIRLLARAYVPRASELDKLGILGADVADLIETIDHNIEPKGDAPRFQRKVMYDNLPADALQEFRELNAKHSQELLEKLDAWLATRDRDNNPSIHGTGRKRAGVGIFYFESDFEMQSPDNKET